MAISNLRTGPNLLVKIAYDLPNGPERTLGYAQALNFTVINGQKEIFTVDSPFPGEIAQAAGPSYVRGSFTLFMPKGSNPISAGLIAPTSGPLPDTSDPADMPRMSTSKYMHIRIYDRFTQELSFAVNFVKVSQWTTSIAAKQVVQVQLQFSGMFVEIGLS